jgi:hypothetical protein
MADQYQSVLCRDVSELVLTAIQFRLREGLATGQLDQGFPWFSLVPEQMLS